MFDVAPVVSVVTWNLSVTEPKLFVPVTVAIDVPVGAAAVPANVPAVSVNPVGIAGSHEIVSEVSPLIFVFRLIPDSTPPDK